MQAGLVALSASLPSPGSRCKLCSCPWPCRSSITMSVALRTMQCCCVQRMQLPSELQQPLPPAPTLDCHGRMLCRYCSELLIDAYRYPAVDSPHRNHTYIEAVTCYLGELGKLLPVTAVKAVWTPDFAGVQAEAVIIIVFCCVAEMCVRCAGGSIWFMHAPSYSMHLHGFVRSDTPSAHRVLTTVLVLLAGKPYAIFCGIIQCEFKLCSPPCIHLCFAGLPCWQTLFCLNSMSSRSLHLKLLVRVQISTCLRLVSATP